MVENIFIETIWLTKFGSRSTRFKFEKAEPLARGLTVGEGKLGATREVFG